MPPEVEIPPLRIGERDVPVRVRVSPRAGRLVLRFDARQDCLALTTPPGVSARMIRRFLTDHTDWILRRLDAAPPRVPFVPGNTVPVQGQPRLLCHDPAGRRRIDLLEDRVQLSGPAENPESRIRDFLVRLARQDITTCCRTLEGQAAGRIRRISVRDTRSRWGSCTATGDLSFSWRLVLAPPMVLRYVVAHELAHLAEMNHSPRFWAEVARLMPDYPSARDWLKRHGNGLHLYG